MWVYIFFLCISDKLVATRLLGQFYIFLRFYTFVSVACRLVKETVGNCEELEKYRYFHVVLCTMHLLSRPKDLALQFAT